MNYSEGGGEAPWLLSMYREHTCLARQWRVCKKKRGSVVLAGPVVKGQEVMGLSQKREIQT